MSLKERLATSKKIFAIELSTNKEVKDLELLRAIEPTFISVTWHGSPCDSHTDYEQIPPIALAKQMQLLNYEVLVHFPGRYLTEDQATKVLVTLKKNHVKNLFIVQGDVSEKCEEKGHFKYAADLVRFVRKHFDDYFCIGTTIEPEEIIRHSQEYLSHFRNKIESGVDFLITQVILDAQLYKTFHRKLLKELKITLPVLPGLFLFKSAKDLVSLQKWCSVEIPESLREKVEEMKNNESGMRSLGVSNTVEIIRSVCEDESGIGVHVFCMNEFELVGEVREKCFQF